nr:MAG TPA: hypothetical protein [Caudoviricetes sp.]
MQIGTKYRAEILVYRYTYIPPPIGGCICIRIYTPPPKSVHRQPPRKKRNE